MTKKNDKKVENKIEVRLQPLNNQTLKIKLIGKTPLLMDKMSEDVKQGILEKQSGMAKGNKKKIRNINKEVENAIHKTSKGIVGFPAFGFKKGMIEVTSFLGDKFFSKKLVSGAVRIINQEDGLVKINSKKQDVLEHTIHGQTKFNPCFHDWSCELVIQYDANNISPSDIVTLLNYAGFYYGVGSWRPKCTGGGSGEYGTYEVQTN